MAIWGIQASEQYAIETMSLDPLEMEDQMGTMETMDTMETPEGTDQSWPPLST